MDETIPVFITTADGKKPTEEQIRGIAELVKKHANDKPTVIKEMRKKAGKTLRETATYLDIGMAKLCDYEYGRDMMDAELFGKFYEFVAEGLERGE